MPENRRRVRNLVARSPLLRKGGPHQKSRSGERHDQRRVLEEALNAWWEERDDIDLQNEESVPEDAGSSSTLTIPQQFGASMTWSPA